MSETPFTLNVLEAVGRPRRAQWLMAAATTAMAMVLTAAAVSAQPLRVPSAAEQQFTAATRDYAWLHRRIEAVLGPIEINADMGRIDRAVHELAAAIRAERTAAAAGDLFTPAVGAEFRWRIADALAAHDLTPEAVLEAERADGVDSRLVSLRVNGPFPWELGTAMFPCVLDALPELPPELQYRIVGETLVLVDVHASLIVDLLPGALAPMTER